MKVSLRKAAALSQLLFDASKKFPLTKTISFSIYADVSVGKEMIEAREAFEANLTAAGDLVAGAYVIRALLGDANNKFGVDARLAEQAGLSAREKLLTAAIAGNDAYGAVAYKEPNTVGAQLSAMIERSKSSERIRSDDSLTVNVLDAGFITEIQNQLADIRRRKVAISDDLLGINTGQTVELPESVVKLLQSIKAI
jgi:hypothetical protein